ncbi:hypothetical protein SAMN04487895_12352 [Paenibacillus sophorae]|uniref:Uncharacterized protein n=1 Tax=Paenibacillus sophorae TaxID=1333845 RepID=A0A1H8VET5_9BACL|nr:hypothetical protein [Paenibacillus sophorae]QWU16656.1 hypothetical protein KP014_05390 [Paenibacillus sophorae]SEP13763.1 hypothetical protein SAMN04487895_12352 [Paenibacillus sophorae]
MNKLFKSVMCLAVVVVLLFPVSAFAADKSLDSVVDFTGFNTTLTVGETADFTALIHDSSLLEIGDYDFVPVSSDTSVLKVESVLTYYSHIHAVGVGTATLTVDIGHGYTPYTVTIKVVDSQDSANNSAEDSTNNDPVDYTASDDYYGTDEDYTDDDANDVMLDALVEYVDQIAPLGKYENLALSTYNKYRVVTPSNRKKAYLAFNNVIVPNYTKLVVGLKKAEPSNEELAVIHSYYLSGAKLQLEGFTIMKNSLYSTKIDKKKYAEANKKMTAGTALFNKALAKMDEYSSKYGG